MMTLFIVLGSIAAYLFITAYVTRELRDLFYRRWFAHLQSRAQAFRNTALPEEQNFQAARARWTTLYQTRRGYCLEKGLQIPDDWILKDYGNRDYSDFFSPKWRHAFMALGISLAWPAYMPAVAIHRLGTKAFGPILTPPTMRKHQAQLDDRREVLKKREEVLETIRTFDQENADTKLLREIADSMAEQAESMKELMT